MKQFFFLFFLATCIFCQSFLAVLHSAVIYPIYDSSEVLLPRNLRTVLHVRLNVSSLNLQGFGHLRISGSGQFSEKTFMAMMHSLSISPKQLIVLDIRQESHGFINGLPISWTNGNNHANVHKTKDEIESDESQRLRLAIHAQQIIIDPLKKSTKLMVYMVKTERELVEGYGSIYVRLPVTDHGYPSNEVIDQFIELIKNFSPDFWIHIHCKAGKGRTTTFLTLFDIAKNARHVSLKDILTRQYLIGGIDLTDVQKRNEDRSQVAKERLKLIQNFYLYCQQVLDFQVSWSDWLEKKRVIFADNAFH